MQEKSLIFESNINEIYSLINENSFNDVWLSIKEKINDSISRISTKEEAASFITNLYNKISKLPPLAKNKIIKYSLTALIAIFGLNALMSSMPADVQAATQNLIDTTSINIPVQIQKIPTNSSQEIKDFIKKEEGFSLKAYALGDGMITIGWGHAERKNESQFKVGQKITEEKAQQLFDKDINEAESGLNRIFKEWEEKGIKVKVNQDMYDAMVSMIFNMGIGNFRKSEFIQFVKHNKLKEAKDRILTTNVNYPGVKKRRQSESEIFGQGVFSLIAAHELREYIRREIAKLL
jgi:GH24 family phage-related lysozyme (muramidase)